MSSSAQPPKRLRNVAVAVNVVTVVAAIVAIKGVAMGAEAAMTVVRVVEDAMVMAMGATAARAGHSRPRRS